MADDEDEKICFVCEQPINVVDIGTLAHAGWVHWSHIHSGEVEL